MYTYTHICPHLVSRGQMNFSFLRVLRMGRLIKLMRSARPVATVSNSISFISMIMFVMIIIITIGIAIIISSSSSSSSRSSNVIIVIHWNMPLTNHWQSPAPGSKAARQATSLSTRLASHAVGQIEQKAIQRKQ